MGSSAKPRISIQASTAHERDLSHAVWSDDQSGGGEEIRDGEKVTMADAEDDDERRRYRREWRKRWISWVRQLTRYNMGLESRLFTRTPSEKDRQ